MQRYYLHAKAVRARGRPPARSRRASSRARRPVVRKLDASFVLWNGKLSTRGPEVFRERPSEMVRIFRVALDTGAEIYGHTRDLVAEAVRAPRRGRARSARDPDAAARTSSRCSSTRATPRSPSLLEQMHDLGLLAALMPEFGPCTGRVQHDLYHVFTVDQHRSTRWRA